MEIFNDPNAVSILVLLAIWTIPWKGYAMWKAARLNKPYWFWALLLINTLGALEITYIFFISKQQQEKMKKDVK